MLWDYVALHVNEKSVLSVLMDFFWDFPVKCGFFALLCLTCGQVTANFLAVGLLIINLAIIFKICVPEVYELKQVL